MPRPILLGVISFTAAKTFPRERSGHGGQVVEGDVGEGHPRIPEEFPAKPRNVSKGWLARTRTRHEKCQCV